MNTLIQALQQYYSLSFGLLLPDFTSVQLSLKPVPLVQLYGEGYKFCKEDFQEFSQVTKLREILMLLYKK